MNHNGPQTDHSRAQIDDNEATSWPFSLWSLSSCQRNMTRAEYAVEDGPMANTRDKTNGQTCWWPKLEIAWQRRKNERRCWQQRNRV